MKNKIIKYWPIQPSNGALQYWDGEQWVVLPNGLHAQYLMTHGTTKGPTWEYLIKSSSSSSSSSSFIPPVDEIGFKADSMGPISDTNANMIGDAHYFFGGYKSSGQTTTKDRDGNIYTDLRFPYTAAFNWDDNSSTAEIVWFTMEDPIRNKLYVITYTQKTNSLFPAMAIGSIRVISKELHVSSSSYSSTGSITYTVSNDLIKISGNGEFDFKLETSLGGSSSANQVHSIKGRYWNGSSYVDVSETVLGPPNGSPPVAVVAFDTGSLLTSIRGESSPDGYHFWQQLIGIPGITDTSQKPGYFWHDIRNAGGRFGGMYFDIFNKLTKYRDKNVDPTGHPNLLALGIPSSIAQIGVYGLYSNEMNSSSSSWAPLPGKTSHWIPLNNQNVATLTNIDINNWLNESSRDDFYGISIPYPSIGV